MNDIVISEYDDVNIEELLKLYDSVGWSNYTKNPSMLAAAYNNSLKILSAWHVDKLVGIIRVVGDGCSIIYIQDIIVCPEYQGLGIGSALLKRIAEEYETVYQKILLTDNTEKTVKFYEKCGFTQSSKYQCTAFVKFTF